MMMMMYIFWKMNGNPDEQSLGPEKKFATHDLPRAKLTCSGVCVPTRDL